IERFEDIVTCAGHRLIGREARLHPVRELAKAHRPRHPRASLQRVKRAAQLADNLVVVWVATPESQLVACTRKQLARLFEKDRQYELVDLVGNVEERLVGWNRRH